MKNKKWLLAGGLFFNSLISSGQTSFPNVGGGCATGANAGCASATSTYIGNNAAGNSTWGNQNVFVGSEAGRNNGPAGSAGQQGCFNTFLGVRSGLQNTIGQNNTFIGFEAGRENTIGIRNFYMGLNSGLSMTAGIDNVMLGQDAGRFIIGGNTIATSPSQNIFIGNSAGRSQTALATDNPRNNVCIGQSSGLNINAGTGNTFLGSQSCQATSTINCTAIGFNATMGANQNNTTVIGNSSFAECNDCLILGNGGNANSTVGTGPIFRVGIGTRTPIGNFHVADMDAGVANSNDIRFADLPATTTLNNFLMVDNPTGVPGAGNNNSRLYYRTLNIPTTYSNCSPTTNNYVPYWNNQQLTCLSPIYIDPVTVNSINGSVGIGTTTIRSYSNVGTYAQVSGSPANGTKATLDVAGLTFTNTLVVSSDERYKKNIKVILNALDKVKSIAGYNYEWKKEEFKERNFDNNMQAGFLAQEVAKVIPEAVYKDNEGFYAMNYNAITPVLLEAIKEQQTQIEALKNKLNDVETALAQCCTQYENRTGYSGGAQLPVLEQNTPNPFNQTSTIGFYIPSTATSASVTIYTNTGVAVKSFNNLASGKGNVQVQSGTLAPGTYIYNLVVNNKQVDTKWMIITK